MAGDLVFKQAVAVIDKRTTIVCLHVAGQIRQVTEPFDTLNGSYDMPGFHIHCRTISAPWMPGFVNAQREESNAELLRRPLKQRRLGPNGELGARLPPGPLGDAPTGIPVNVPKVPVSAYTEARLTGIGEWDAAELQTIDETTKDIRRFGRGDHTLEAMWRKQGFDGRPTLGEVGEVDAEIGRGGVEIWRGIKGDGSRTGGQLAEQFRSGDGVYGGKGIYGNGTYFAYKGGGFAEFEARMYAGKDGAVFRSVLRHDAKVVKYQDLMAEMGREKNLPDVLSDPGRYGTARGYDAIISGEPEFHLIVLNRTAVIVEKVDR
jgi:hypothetical protein